MSKINRNQFGLNLNVAFGKNITNNENSKFVINSINELLTKIKDCKNYHSFIEVLDGYVEHNKSAEYINSNIIKHEEYYLVAGLESDTNYYRQIYPSIAKKGIKIIPEYIDSAKIPDGFSITVLKIPGTAQNGLLDFEDNYAILSDKQKQQAYQDVKTLLKIGIINPEIETSALKITADREHHIICTNWENLEPLEKYKEDLGQNAEQILISKYYKKFFK